jgi:dipeptidyl aminopeptidase/acylaminoacyl peptidase
MGIQFWTTRGWAVVDVNYRGSTGYGRRYRNQLHQAWGVADVADCIAVATWLADAGEVDATRMVIRGGSAGGFTALSALATADVFAAGVSAYGIADLEMLAAETHKFESGYNDWLLGSHADHPERWADRSPINHVDRLTSPLLVLQGTDDAVVPPSQSELIVNALRQRGVPVAYLLFDGEGHGFRSADTQRRALDAEQQFLTRVLGLSGGRGVSTDAATDVATDAGGSSADPQVLHIHNMPPGS